MRQRLGPPSVDDEGQIVSGVALIAVGVVVVIVVGGSRNCSVAVHLEDVCVLVAKIIVYWLDVGQQPFRTQSCTRACFLVLNA